MKCNVCGADIPAGSAACPVCGSPAPMEGAGMGGYSMAGGNAAPTSPFGADPANQAAQGYGAYGQAPQGYDPYQQPIDPYGAPMSAPVAVPKKSNTGLIIGIIAAVAVVATVVVLLLTGVIGGGGNSGKNGTYILDSAEMYGQTFSGSQLTELGLNVDSFKIEISGRTATVKMVGKEASCKVEFSDNDTKVKFVDGNDTIEGTYDNSAKTITVTASGVKMTFKKK